MVHPVPVTSISESDDFLNFFVDKVDNVRMSNGSSILSVCVSGPPPPHLLSVFNPMTIHDLSLLLDKMKITTCANDILPAGLFKNALSVIGPSIVEICNASLSTGVVHRFVSMLLLSSY